MSWTRVPTDPTEWWPPRDGGGPVKVRKICVDEIRAGRGNRKSLYAIKLTRWSNTFEQVGYGSGKLSYASAGADVEQSLLRQMA
jgi:hypothetical protein